MAEKKEMNKVKKAAVAAEIETKKTVRKAANAVSKKKAEIKDAAKTAVEKVSDAKAAKTIEAKKTVRKAARNVKETVSTAAKKAVSDAKLNADEKKLVKQIEDGKTAAAKARKKEESANKSEARKQAVKKPAAKAKAAKMNIVVQSPMGGSITPEEIAQKVPAGSTDVYVRIDENKIYWVNKEETGSITIWE